MSRRWFTVLLLLPAATLHCAEVFGLDPPTADATVVTDPIAGGEEEAPVPAPLPAPSGQSCLEALAATGATFTPARTADEPAPFAGCGMVEGVTVSRGPSDIQYRPPIRVSCAFALALPAVERIVQDTGNEVLGGPVEIARTMGSYGCRMIQSARLPGRLSEHAFGNAVDVGEWWTSSKRAVVVRDFRRDGLEGDFLRTLAMRLRASSALERLLDPDYDAAHRNHFHLEGHPLP